VTAPQTPDPRTIEEWAASTSPALRVAARLAADIVTGKLSQYSPLPDHDTLMSDHCASRSTVTRAKQMLARDYGLITRGTTNRYYVA
jgi:DNA-binding GntR family transcriptional regulator